MIRSDEDILHEEAIRALEQLLPRGWIIRKINPDFGLDLEITIVEQNNVTNDVSWAQIKSTRKNLAAKKIALSLETRYLKYYEHGRLPILLFYYIKPKKAICYLFVQKYIQEILAKKKPAWRDQEYITIHFESKLSSGDEIAEIIRDGYYYIITGSMSKDGVMYWLDGIPRSDDVEIKKRTWRAMLDIEEYKYQAGIDEMERILRELVLSPSQRMSTLISIGNALYRSKQLDGALEHYESALTVMQRVNESEARLGESFLRNNMSRVYMIKGDLDTALNLLQQALSLCKQINNIEGEACALGNMGVIYDTKGDLDKSLDFQQQALALHKQIGRKEGEAGALVNIGLIHNIRGEFDKALDFLKQALAIDNQIGDKEGVAVDLCNIGIIYQTKGDLDMALDMFNQALALDQQIGNKEGEASDLGNIGLLYSAEGNLNEALDLHKQALALHRQVGNKECEAKDLGNIGSVYMIMGNNDTALDFQQQALTLEHQIGDKRSEAVTLNSIGFINMNKGNNDMSLDFYQQALILSQKIGDKEIEASVLGNIGLVHIYKGDYKSGREFLQQAMSLHHQTGDEENEVNDISKFWSVYKKKGDYNLIHDFLQQALDFSTKASNEKIRNRIQYIVEDILESLKKRNKFPFLK